MKKFYFLAMICLSLVAFVGCSKKEENKQEAKNPLLGTWGLVETDKGKADPCQSRGTISFTETKLTSIEFEQQEGKCLQDETFEVNYKINGDVILFSRLSAEHGQQEISMKFKVDGNKLFLEVLNSTMRAIYTKR